MAAATTTATAFRVLLRMRCHPGRGADFEQAWQEGAALIAAQDANHGQWLARSTEDPATFYVVSDWTDEPAFRAYEHSAVHQEHLARLRPFRADGEMTTMDLVHSVPAEARRR
jgi:heme-degrading monooxygenase HmoA